MSAKVSPENRVFEREISFQNALAVFCRAPRLGQVKTRLAATQGDSFVLGLYDAMLQDTFVLGRALAPEVDIWAYYTPEEAFDTCLEETGLAQVWEGTHFAQCKGDLGAKMIHAFSTLHAQGYRNVAVMGTDSPDLPINHIRAAFDLLQHTDFVIGPSDDGGFYLLGASRPFEPTIFEDIEWSTENVYSRLMQNVRSLTPAWTTQSLPSWRDVDDATDLEALRQRLLHGGTHAPHTRAFLEQERPQLDG